MSPPRGCDRLAALARLPGCAALDAICVRPENGTSCGALQGYPPAQGECAVGMLRAAGASITLTDRSAGAVLSARTLARTALTTLLGYFQAPSQTQMIQCAC